MTITHTRLPARALLSAAVALLLAPIVSADPDPLPQEVLWFSSLPLAAGVSAPQASRSGSPTPAPEPHVLRRGAVMLDVDAFLPFDAATGRRAAPASNAMRASGAGQAAGQAEPPARQMLIAPFPEIAYLVSVSRESHPQADVVNLSGRLPEAELDTVAITVTAEGYLITVQDLDRAMTYQIVGDAATGLGTVTEIDTTALPPRRYTPPLIVP